MLVTGERTIRYDRAAYARWLADLRAVCTARGIPLILDEVFLGFRLARGGAQEYFGVRADMVTYGKTLGGGLPIGAVCGRRELMRRFREDSPTDICFARGTFNSHPYVMTAMNELLRHLDDPFVVASYRDVDDVWSARARKLNARLEELDVPVRVANMASVWTTLYTKAGRYHWMLQYYLRAEGLALSWVGTGRFIFSHDLTDAVFDDIVGRFVAAVRAMRGDGWWWRGPTLTSARIQRRVLSEVVGAALRRRSRASRA
jgi:glutamate-1-semialdehyde 2,1-aminomutase